MAEDRGRQSDDFDTLSLGSHQMRSPLVAARSLLQTVLAGYAGPLSERQLDMLQRVDQRCLQAEKAIHRLLTVARLRREKVETTVALANLVFLVDQLSTQHAGQAHDRSIEMVVDSDVGDGHVRGTEALFTEVLQTLLENAFKYTPDHGTIRLSLRADREELTLAVADSGIGIPAHMREQVFEPFVRGGQAKDSSIPGTGLGLTLVRAVVEASGGRVSAQTADLGGAEIVIRMPLVHQEVSQQMETHSVKHPLRVVIVGGVAAGPKVASKVIRLRPDAEVTIVEKGKFLSYAGCGLPYYVSGAVKEQKELMSTPAGAVRDPVFFQHVKNVRILNETEALEIDRAGKRLRVRGLVQGQESWIEYDKLVLATGAKAVVPPIPGTNLENVFTLQGVRDAEGIRALLAQDKARDVVIVGGGLIGVEITEALVQRGCRVTMVEMMPQTLRMLDPDMACLVEQHMESHGVKVLVGTKVEAIEGDNVVRSVMTSAGRVPADMVVLAIGVRPNVALAKAAGLEIGRTGAIKVDDRMQTSDSDIFAAGDCVECKDLMTGGPCFVPLGSTANKQGRVAAVNVCGGQDRFSGVLGSTVCKVFDFCVGRTGLGESAAKAQGYDTVVAIAPAPDRAHFMPGAKLLILKLIADRKSRKLLGAQTIGPGAGDKRIDVAAMGLTAGITVDQLANADLCYAPPYAPAMDNIITAANVLRNKMDGCMEGVSVQEVHEMQRRKGEFVFLDVRSPKEYEQVRLPGSTLIPLGTLRGRLGELPRDKEIVAFCKISLRGYEAALILKAAGFQKVRVMDGGLVMWPFEKIT
ncbi:MAG: FAD-dependent oxidoreductase [Phycisphaerales bacterium]|jgi:NADPH-dependent 2,4-dienoyl-CoA reductase/sulfur reductase-like enzyme/rhodanese-related sulfurtransferase/two-component sensor histidine kinase